MKKILSLTAIAAALALSLASCSREELNTDQYATDGRVLLQAYGPQPVVRGGTLRLIGSNLDQVASVTIPENNVITDINVVSSGVHSEITVTVPKETSAPGYPVLTLKDGTTITGKTLLSYSEPITITTFTHAVYPGDNFTVEGDYLNLIHEIIFANKVKVSENDFSTHTRYKIVVKVPAEARTGKVGLGTIDESKAENEDLLASLNIVETENEVNVMTAQGKLAKSTLKAGEDLTINGSRLDLVTKVILEGAEVTEFTVSKSGNKLDFTLPATASDGEVLLVMASGVEVSAGELSTVKPEVTGLDPETIVPGNVLTIKGTDLDLVESVEIPSADTANSWPDFDLNGTTSIKVTVPVDATGASILLHLENGEAVEVPLALSLSTIESFSPEEITAGDKFTVTGTNFQLVQAVGIGSVACEFTVDSETQITVTSDPASQSGFVVLTLLNGKKVMSDGQIKVNAAGVVQVTSLPASASVGDEITMEGSGFNFIESIWFGETKITAYSKRTDTEMVFTIPVSLEAGNYTPRFVLTTEEEEMCAMSIDVKGMITTIVLFEGSHEMDLSWDGGKALYLGADQFGKVPLEGATLHIEFECTPADYNNMQLCYNTDGWPKLGEYDIAGKTSLTIDLDREAVQNMYSYGLVVFGYAWITSKVYITYENQSYDPVLVGDIMLVDWDDHGGHNGYWDQPDGWGGCKTELIWRSEGNLNLRIMEDQAGDAWTVCCNHQSNYTENVPAWAIDDASKYVVKIDIMIEDGVGSLSAADMTFNPVFGDNWTGGKGAGFFPATTDGKWITVTIDLGLSGAFDCNSGINGFMAGNVPAGLNIDNFRFSLR